MEEKKKLFSYKNESKLLFFLYYIIWSSNAIISTWLFNVKSYRFWKDSWQGFIACTFRSSIFVRSFEKMTASYAHVSRNGCKVFITTIAIIIVIIISTRTLCPAAINFEESPQVGIYFADKLLKFSLPVCIQLIPSLQRTFIFTNRNNP